MYRDSLQLGNDNSDVSEVDAEDLAKMVKVGLTINFINP